VAAPVNGVYTITGSGFQPGEHVTATITDTTPISLGTTTANAQGQVTFTFTPPTGFPAGSHQAVLVGATSGTVEQTFSVTAALPQSGANASLQLALAALMTCALGACLITGSRRLRRA
jgi:hypothetical protein